MCNLITFIALSVCACLCTNVHVCYIEQQEKKKQTAEMNEW